MSLKVSIFLAVGGLQMSRCLLLGPVGGWGQQIHADFRAALIITDGRPGLDDCGSRSPRGHRVTPSKTKKLIGFRPLFFGKGFLSQRKKNETVIENRPGRGTLSPPSSRRKFRGATCRGFSAIHEKFRGLLPPPAGTARVKMKIFLI